MATGTKHRYSTDVSDEQWELIRTLVERERQMGRPTIIDLRAVVNALLYLTRTGCSRRTSPTGTRCAPTSITGPSTTPSCASMMPGERAPGARPAVIGEPSAGIIDSLGRIPTEGGVNPLKPFLAFAG